MKDQLPEKNGILEKEKKILLVNNFRPALQIYENSLRHTSSNHSTIHRNLVQTLNNIMPRQLPSAGTSLTASPRSPVPTASPHKPPNADQKRSTYHRCTKQEES